MNLSQPKWFTESFTHLLNSEMIHWLNWLVLGHRCNLYLVWYDLLTQTEICRKEKLIFVVIETSHWLKTDSLNIRFWVKWFSDLNTDVWVRQEYRSVLKMIHWLKHKLDTVLCQINKSLFWMKFADLLSKKGQNLTKDYQTVIYWTGNHHA